MRKNNIILLSMMVLFAVFVLFLLFWLYSHSRITISLAGSEQVTVRITSEDLDEDFIIKDNNFSKVVSKGEYTLVIQSNTGSMVSNIKTGSFLKNTSVVYVPVQKNNSEFIGDNPRECLDTLETLLISYPCRGSLNDLGVHLPATNNLPTYFKTIESSISDSEEPVYDIGSIEGVVDLQGKKYVLVNQPEIEFFSIRKHVIYELIIENNSVSTIFITDLDLLNPGFNYTIKSNETGEIVIYNDSLSEIYTGTSFENLNRLGFSMETVEGFTPVTSVFSKENNLRVYNETPEDFSSLDTNKLSSKVILFNSNETEKNFENYLNDLKICGIFYCALSSIGELLVYNEEFEKQFSVFGVRDFVSSGDKIWAVFDLGVSEIDLNSRSGYLSYNSKEFDITNVSKTSQGIVVTTALDTKKYALLIRDSKSSFDISEKITTLVENEYVDLISIYKNTIFISPDLGELEPSVDGSGLDYSAEVKQKASTEINALISELLLKENGYSIKVNNL